MGVLEEGPRQRDEAAVRAADAKLKSREPRRVRLDRVAPWLAVGVAGGALLGILGEKALDDIRELNAAREFTKNSDALEQLRQCQQPAETLGELVVLELVDPGEGYDWKDTTLAALVATEGNADELAAALAAQSDASQMEDQRHPGWQVGEIGVFARHDVDAGSTTGDNPIFRVAEIQGIVCQPEEFMPRSVDTQE